MCLYNEPLIKILPDLANPYLTSLFLKIAWSMLHSILAYNRKQTLVPKGLNIMEKGIITNAWSTVLYNIRN